MSNAILPASTVNNGYIKFENHIRDLIKEYFKDVPGLELGPGSGSGSASTAISAGSGYGGVGHCSDEAQNMALFLDPMEKAQRYVV